MLSRRHIRVKVMQSLYSFLSAKENDIITAEKKMLQHFDSVASLKLVIISLVVEIVNYANQFYEEAKYKHLPTISDLNPNTKFLKNKVLIRILNDKELVHKA